MSDNKPSPTVKDIALAAGVSTATVSRVLNDKAGVDENAKERVLSAIAELGYTPQRNHRRSEGKPWIAVLTDSSITAFHGQVLAAIQEKAMENGLFPFVMQMPANADKQAEVLAQMKQQSWAGVISAGFYMSPESWKALHEEMGIPVVLMNALVSDPGMACLKVNFEGAIASAIQHLTTLGHSRIAYLGDAANEFSQAEFHGVVSALSQRGIEYPDEYRITTAHTPEGATQSISRIMMLPKDMRPTALIAFDDDFAIQLLSALRYYKLSVPDDISIIGFDNIPMSAKTYPALTTIDVPKYRIGEHLVALTQQLIQTGGNTRIGNIIIEGSLVVRESTGPVPK